MKLLPINTQKRVNTEDSLGHGMDAVMVLVLFLLAGFGLDRLFGTMPVFMIVMSVLGAVGLFYKFKYSYSARMDELEQERRGAGHKSQHAQHPDSATADPAAPVDPETVA